MNRDVSTGPLARPFARSLAPLTRGEVNFLCLKMTWFCPIVGRDEGEEAEDEGRMEERG